MSKRPHVGGQVQHREYPGLLGTVTSKSEGPDGIMYHVSWNADRIRWEAPAHGEPYESIEYKRDLRPLA